MRGFKNILKALIISLLFLNTVVVNADSVPIKEVDADNILEPQHTSLYDEKDDKKVEYVQKNIEIKEVNNPNKPIMGNKVELKPIVEIKPQPKEQEPIGLQPVVEKTEIQNIVVQDKKQEKKRTRRIFNIIVNEQNDRVISESSRKINAIYPYDDVNLKNTYPGYRGPNQLVIYTRDYGKTTLTNEFGKEAVVVDDIVVALTGANSKIPSDGYVISGHGSAKKWIGDNLKIGTKIQIIDRTLRSYTTIDSYRYYAKSKIKDVEDILMSTRFDYIGRDDKFVYYYLKKAKQQYRKSKKDRSDASLRCAKESIENASIAFRYTLPYIKNELKGTWVRPNQKTIQEVQKTLDRIKDAGINNVFLETYFHGRTIFNSDVMKEYGFYEKNPDLADFDMLEVWIREAHKRNIKVHAWFESFYIGNKNPEMYPQTVIALKPEWMNRTKQKADFEGYVSHPAEHNGYFLDPANPEVTDFLIKLINEITYKYNVDGINIDYVRYPNISKENYNNQWGYTKYAREEFKMLYEIDPIEIEPKSSDWDDWCQYRRDKITNYIKKVSELVDSRNIMFSAVIFPDYKVSLQTKFQDWAMWLEHGYLDAITPLILTGDEGLAKSMLEEIKKKTPDKSSIYPGLFAGFIESDAEDLLRQIHIVRKLKLNGVILFDWAHLNNNYIDVLKASAFREKSY